MKVFTYKDYIQCIHTLRLNTVSKLAEESTEYSLETEEECLHDRTISELLKDTKEVAKFINQFVRPKEEVKADELILYNKKNNLQEDNKVYKIQNKGKFFWIKHQTTIDYNLQYKILNTCIDIMQEYNKNKKVKNIYSYPIIVPIIIYTGNEKWKIPKYFKESLANNYLCEEFKVQVEYNLIDINKISNYNLLKSNTIFGSIMLIEKARSKQQLLDKIASIIKVTKEDEKLKKLVTIMNYLLDNLLEDVVKKIDKQQLKNFN